MFPWRDSYVAKNRLRCVASCDTFIRLAISTGLAVAIVRIVRPIARAPFPVMQRPLPAASEPCPPSAGDARPTKKLLKS